MILVISQFVMCVLVMWSTSWFWAHIRLSLSYRIELHCIWALIYTVKWCRYISSCMYLLRYLTNMQVLITLWLVGVQATVHFTSMWAHQHRQRHFQTLVQPHVLISRLLMFMKHAKWETTARYTTLLTISSVDLVNWSVLAILDFLLITYVVFGYFCEMADLVTEC